MDRQTGGHWTRDDKQFQRFLCILRETQQETRSVSTVHRGNAEIVYRPCTEQFIKKFVLKTFQNTYFPALKFFYAW